MWVKVCANTNREDTQRAIDLGADAVGFVFAPSARRIEPHQAAQISSQLVLNGRYMERTGVFQGHSLDDIVEAVSVASLTGIQLHDVPCPDLLAALHREFHDDVTVTQTLHWMMHLPGESNIHALGKQMESLRETGHVHRILIDTKVGKELGGTGTSFDWEMAHIIFEKAAGMPMIVAGGLNPQNVSRAMETLKPWGVDVASGVESVPGRKDPDRLRLFMERVRASGEVAPA